MMILTHLNRLSLLTACVLLTIGSVRAAETRFSEWATINNKRFGFSIAYPSQILFPVDTPSGNLDGRVMQSADSKAKLLVVTFENTDQMTLDAYRDFLLKDVYANTALDYAPRKDRWFVLSGVRGEETFYERVTFSCGGKLINSWAMVYPTAQKSLYDRIVEAVAKTYTAGAGADGNCGLDTRQDDRRQDDDRPDDRRRNQEPKPQR